MYLYWFFFFCKSSLPYSLCRRLHSKLHLLPFTGFGNVWKCVWANPFVLFGKFSYVIRGFHKRCEMLCWYCKLIVIADDVVNSHRKGGVNNTVNLMAIFDCGNYASLCQLKRRTCNFSNSSCLLGRTRLVQLPSHCFRLKTQLESSCNQYVVTRHSWKGWPFACMLTQTRPLVCSR